MRFRTPHWGATYAMVCLLSSASAAGAATIAVPAGGDFQAALNAAKAGDVITLAPGATYTGNFVLPNKGVLTDYITIRSAAADSDLPGAGIRLTPAYAAMLPKIKSSNTIAALRTAVAANHYRLMFLEFPGNVNGYGDVVSLGAGDSTQTQLAQVPFALVVDRVYIHGDPLLGQKRGIGLNSSDTTIVNSYISECKGIGQDTQAISGFNGPGNYLIENNYLEAAGENFLLGGADPPITNLVTTNVTFRRNFLRKPIDWRDPIVATPTAVSARSVPGGTLAAGAYFYKVVARRTAGQTNKAVSTPSAEVSATIAAGTTGSVTIAWTPVVNAEDYLVYGRTSGGENVNWKTTTPYFTDSGAAGTAGAPSSSGTKWSVKNLFELKSAQDVLIEGNVFEGMWMADQPGYPIVFTPRNQGGAAPWSTVQRVTFQRNLVRHTAGGVNILGEDNLHPSQLANHLTIRDNVFDDMNATTWGTGSRPFQIGAGPDTVTIDHNTIITTDSTIVALYGGTTASPTPVTNAVFTNNLTLHNTYGIFGTGLSTGLVSINAYMPGGIVRGNALAGGAASKYPAGNFFPTVAAWPSLFTGYAVGDYHLAASSGLINAGTDGKDVGANVEIINAQSAVALSGDDRMPPGAIPIVITPSTLPNAVLNQPYAQSLTCNEGRLACTWTVRDASLPAGLAFDAVAGLVFGTPTAVQTGTLTVDASDPTLLTNSATGTFQITVDPPPFVVTMPAAPAGQVGVAYQLSPTVTGTLGSAAWSVASGNLPGGVTLDPYSGSIGGVPSAWGAFTALVQAADSWSVNRVSAQPVTITVAPTALSIATASLVSASYRTAYSAMLAASGGTGATTWSLADGRLPSGVALDAGGVVSGTPGEIGTFAVTVRADDANWAGNTATRPLTITVDPPLFSCSVPAAPDARVGQAYQLVASASGNVGTVSWSIASGGLPPGLALDVASGAIAGTPAQWGRFTFVVQAADSWGGRVDAKTVTIAVAPTPIAIATTTLASATYQTAYQASLAATGGTGAATFAIVSGALPAGVSMTAAGAIAGTPSAAASIGTFTVTVQATDANWASNTDTKTLTLVVGAPAFSASIAPLSSGGVGLPYQLAGSAAGSVGSTIWSLSSGALPPGLVLGAASGAIVGVPAAFGSFMAVVTAQDSWNPSRSISMTTRIDVAPLPIAVSTATLAAGSVRQPYQATLTANGGTGLTSWSVVSGTLPAGLQLSANGVLSGTPTAVGAFTFTVQATDAGWAGNAAQATLSVTVGAREIVLYASDATSVAGTWSLVADPTAAGGARLFNPDKAAAKLAAPLAAPANYFEMTFQAEAGVAYHLWMRGKADKDYWGNDSVMVQFSGSTDAAGAAKARMGTTSGYDLNLEDCSGCGIAGWGWQDNGYGANVMGPDVYFAQSGQQTIRVQVKEDGFGIDQIVLSADRYRTVAPGALKNDTTIVSR